jgi:hypothetical protein
MLVKFSKNGVKIKYERLKIGLIACFGVFIYARKRCGEDVFYKMLTPDLTRQVRRELER